MQKEYLKKLLTTSEIQLIVCMLADVGNFDLVMSKFNNLQFEDKTCNKLLNIANDLYTKLGYTSIDNIAMRDYCDRMKFKDNETTEILRTFDIVQESSKLDNFSNFDGIFEQYSMIRSTYKFYNWVQSCGGIDEVSNKLLKLKNMEEVTQVIEGRLLEFFNTGTADASIKDTNLTNMIDEQFIKEIENKDNLIETVPLLSQFYLLNKITKGMVRGLTGFGARSGVGKSSFMASVFITSVLENSKSKICLYMNEQTAKVFAISMFFAFISQVFNMRQNEGGEFEKVGYINLSRDKFISGNFNAEETKQFVQIIKIFKKRYKDKITYSYFEDMTPLNLKRDIRKKVRSGHKYFFYDTFKDSEEDYKKLMNLATTFDQMTKKFPIHGYVSLQLTDESDGVKYLTNKYLASAKGTKRLLETLLLMRRLDKDELKYLKVHKLGKPDQTIALDYNNENYYAIFVDKNRNGSQDIVLLYEIYLDILKYKEIGIIGGGIPKDTIIPIKKKK